jgi:lipoprotein-anchoring transpeptidase ErfK/SrfK
MTHNLIIDPNNNTLYCKRNNKTYNIASGDIFGERQMHRYYTPVGETIIIEKRKTNNKLYRPAIIRMGFYTLPNVALPKNSKPYLIHGPMENVNEIVNNDGTFINQGRLTKGCIRVVHKDMMEIYHNSKVGDKVLIKNYDNAKLNNKIKKYTKTV